MPGAQSTSVPTSVTAFVGRARTGPVDRCVEINSFADFERQFGGLAAELPLGYAVNDFYNNGGISALIVRLFEPVPEGDAHAPLSLQTYLGDRAAKTGLYALDQAPLFNILCIPPDTADGDTPPYVCQIAAEYCATRRAMLILDPPKRWRGDFLGSISVSDLGSLSTDAARSAAVYFPRVIAADPLQNGLPRSFPASGAIAGIWAATDATRGVWKAPAGLAAALSNVIALEANLIDAEIDVLNLQGINCLRNAPTVGKVVVWGARTLRGADQLADEYKYIPVRRTAQYIATSVLANTQWAAFEPNGEPLWMRLRGGVGGLMSELFRQGAFPGATADQAYFVKCDATTTTQADIDAGIVNIQVGFAPLRPAEFVVIAIRQIAGRRD